MFASSTPKAPRKRPSFWALTLLFFWFLCVPITLVSSVMQLITNFDWVSMGISVLYTLTWAIVSLVVGAVFAHPNERGIIARIIAWSDAYAYKHGYPAPINLALYRDYIDEQPKAEVLYVYKTPEGGVFSTLYHPPANHALARVAPLHVL